MEEFFAAKKDEGAQNIDPNPLGSFFSTGFNPSDFEALSPLDDVSEPSSGAAKKSKSEIMGKKSKKARNKPAQQSMMAFLEKLPEKKQKSVTQKPLPEPSVDCSHFDELLVPEIKGKKVEKVEVMYDNEEDKKEA